MPRPYNKYDWDGMLVEYMEYGNDSIAEFLRTKGVKNAHNHIRQYAGWNEARKKFLAQRLEAKQKDILKDDKEKYNNYRKLIKAVLQQVALQLKNNIKYDEAGNPYVKNIILPNVASQIIERCLKSDRLLDGKSTDRFEIDNCHLAVVKLIEDTKAGKIVDFNTIDAIVNKNHDNNV